MKSFTVPFLAAMIAMLSVVGTSRAAAIDDMFDMVFEAERMIAEADGEMVLLESRSAYLYRCVDRLYLASKTGTEPEHIRASLSPISNELMEMQGSFDRCRKDLGESEAMLNVAEDRGRVWEAKGEVRAPKLQRLIQLCRNDLQAAQFRADRCSAGLDALRNHIEGLYAILL